MIHRFARIQLDEEAYELRRDGVVRHVEPKVLDLLLYLVRHPDRLVSKSELLDNVWPDVVVAESALTRAVSLARSALGESARGPSLIETVSGRGYRFRAPAEAGASASDTAMTPVRSGRRRRLGLLTGGVLTASLFAVWLTWPAPIGVYLTLRGLAGPPEHPSLPDRPSIVVLPFAALGPDETQAYLADGIADELIAGLGRYRDLFVIARSSAFAQRGNDVRRAGRDLGVRYVVEGSVRATATRAVVLAQLADATNGFQLWNGRYERSIDDVLDLPTDVSSEILQALGIRIADAEVERIGRLPGAPPDAYAAYVRARMHWYRMTRADNRRAEDLLEHALTMTPDDPRSQALLATTHLAAYGLGWDPSPERLERGRAAAARAIEIDPFSARAHAALAAAHLWSDRRDDALAAARRAVEVGPNSDLCFGVQATALAATGAVGDAIASLNVALRLNPRHPQPYWMLLGYLYQAGGREDRALAVWQQVRQASVDLIPPRLALLEHYAASGQNDTAVALGREILAVNPEFTADMAMALDPRRRAGDERRRLLARAGIR